MTRPILFRSSHQYFKRGLKRHYVHSIFYEHSLLHYNGAIYEVEVSDITIDNARVPEAFFLNGSLPFTRIFFLIKEVMAGLSRIRLQRNSTSSLFRFSFVFFCHSCTLLQQVGYMIWFGRANNDLGNCSFFKQIF